jgi:hypothetical protein
MDNDFSWMGLFKKGYKLQYNLDGKWLPVSSKQTIDTCRALNFQIRYKKINQIQFEMHSELFGARSAEKTFENIRRIFNDTYGGRK